MPTAWVYLTFIIIIAVLGDINVFYLIGVSVGLILLELGQINQTLKELKDKGVKLQ